MVAYFSETEKKDSEKPSVCCLEWSQILNCLLRGRDGQTCLSYYTVRIELLSEYSVIDYASKCGWLRPHWRMIYR